MTKILVIDNYDSFVYTLVAYVRELGAEAEVIRNDAGSAEEVAELAAGYDGILLSPGPGVPAEAGVCPDLVRLAAEETIPLLGVCLGHQALGEVFGATVTHSPVLMHGKTSVITHAGEGIFTGCPTPLTVTRYHSLAIVDETIDLGAFRVTARTDDGVVMAIEHRSAPLHGVQFHPESVLTESGYLMLGNWLEICGEAGAAARAAAMSPHATAISSTVA